MSLGIALAAVAGCAPAQTPRHLILITIDTLRADRVGSYGHSEAQTPHLDALAARGARFDRAYSQAISTPPSHASILTGRNPPAHGLRELWSGTLPDASPTLATVLSERGFATAAFVSGLPLRRGSGLERGFDVYRDVSGRTGLPADRTVDRAIGWLGKPRDARVFMWLHLFDPHAPYYPPESARARFDAAAVHRNQLLPTLDASAEAHPPSEFTADGIATMRRLYDAEIHFADAQIGRLTAALQDLALLDDAIVAVVSDHGELLGELNRFFGHWGVGDATARVPLLLVHPDGRGAGSVVRAPVATVDLVPTLLRWLDVTHALELDGRDLARAGRDLAPRDIYTEQMHEGASRALRRDRWLLVQHRNDAGEWNRGDLFERVSGVLQATDDGARRDELARVLQALGKPPGAPQPVLREVPPDVARQLEALGYAAP
jgi:arylsulfatase A-like enzyme